MAQARGSRGPEAVRPLARPAAERGGLAFAAALGADWSRAQSLLTGLTPDELETLASVALRLGRRAKWQAHRALLDGAVAAVKAGRARRPSLDSGSWDDALEVARRDSSTLRAAAPPVGPFGLPSLSVVSPEDEEPAP